MDFDERILSLYRAGYRIKEIAATAACAPSTVLRRLRGLGVERRAPQTRLTPAAAPTDASAALWPSVQAVVPAEGHLCDGYALAVPLVLIRHAPLRDRDRLGLRTAYLDFTRQQKISYSAPDRYEFAELYAIAAAYAGGAVYRRRYRRRPRHSAAARAKMSAAAVRRHSR